MTFRYARHTNQLQVLTQFYTDVFGLSILGSFEDHESYNGVFLGTKGENWHLEFTSSDEPCNHTFDDDDLITFYPETRVEYEKIVQGIEANNIEQITAKNDYWNRNGIVVKDPDGFIVVLCNLKIK